MDRDPGDETGNGAPLIADLFPVREVAQPRRIVLRDREQPYTLKRSRRRSRIAFLVDENGLAVHAPWHATDAQIEQAVRLSEQWILRKLAQWAARPPVQVRHWHSGETVEYLGAPVTLDVIADPFHKRAELCDERCLRIRVPKTDSPGMVREMVVTWYQRHAKRHFAERLAHYAAGLGVPAPRLFLSGATTRWGSCTANAEVRLNWRLMQAPPDLVDYVVAHETAHLLHLNHSARFWKAVARVYPEYERARAALAAMSRHYMAL